MAGQSFHRPIVPPYYIKDCQISKMQVQVAYKFMFLWPEAKLIVHNTWYL